MQREHSSVGMVFRKSTLNLGFLTLLGSVLFCTIMLPKIYTLPHRYPATPIDLFSHINKFENKQSAGDEPVDRSFQQFVNSKPDSIVIGELKPNSSELELVLLRNKIANTILNMQEQEKANSQVFEAAGDCFIEISRIDRIAGKCHKTSGGLPVCQSDKHIAVNNDCS